jgi:putative colanic acid biosynthesis acetyltransferase WcaF
MNNIVNLGKYNRGSYLVGASPVKCCLWYVVSGLFFESKWFHLIKFKILVLKSFGANLGWNCVIKPNVKIKYPWKLSVGDYTWLGEDVWIDNVYEVSIGCNVCISQGAKIVTGNHFYNDPCFRLKANHVVIEDGVWLCAFSIVGPGVVCRSHSVLTLGSVASNILESYCVYSGSPAKQIRSRVITPASK